MYIAKTFVRRKDGSKRYYFLLRMSVWDRLQKRPVQKFVAYLGSKPVITLKQAEEIAAAKGITVDALRKVRGLTITL